MAYREKILQAMKLAKNKTVFDTHKLMEDKFYNVSSIFYYQGDLFRMKGLANPKTKEIKNVECWLLDQGENPIERCRDPNIYVNQLGRLNEEVIKKLKAPLLLNYQGNNAKDENIENTEEYLRQAHLEHNFTYSAGTNLINLYECEKAVILFIFSKYNKFKKNKLTQDAVDFIKYKIQNYYKMPDVQINSTTYKDIKFVNIVWNYNKKIKFIFRIDEETQKMILEKFIFYPDIHFPS